MENARVLRDSSSTEHDRREPLLIADDASPLGSPLPQNSSLECSSCRYGISCSAVPERCPMCHAEDGWIDAPWRPFGHGVEAAVQQPRGRR